MNAHNKLELPKEVIKNRRRSKRISAIIKFRLALSILVTLIYGLFSLDEEYGPLAFIIDIGLLIYIVATIRNEYTAVISSGFRSDGMVTLTKDVFSDLHECLDYIREASGIEPEKVEYIVAKKDFSVSPSVVSKKKIHRIIIPIGFFKFFRETPNAAKGILAHEMSHVASNDTNLWLLTSLYYKLNKKILLPVVGVITLVSVGLSLSFLSEIQSQSYLYDSRDVSWANTMIMSRIVSQVGGFLVLLAFLYSTQKQRRYSEHYADVFSGVIYGKKPIQDALLYFGESSPDYRSAFSHNPTIKERVEYLEKRDNLFIVKS